MHPATRRYDVDWLRVFATYLLFVFHVAKTFDVSPFYHIKNPEQSLRLDVFTGFVHLWHMPLFFVLVGWSACGALTSRGTRGFLWERVTRLFVPLAMGSLLLCPLIKYVELLSGLDFTARGLSSVANFDESFLEFLPTFYAGLDRFTWAHLWFLAYLFTFTLLYNPWFVRLLRGPDRFATASAGWLYSPLVPLALIQMTLRLVWPGAQNLYNDWANFAYYSLFFILGFMLARYPVWEQVIDREWKRAGGIGLLASGIMYLLWARRDGVIWPKEPTLGAVLALLPLLGLSAVAGYCLIVAMLGVAKRSLTFNNSALRYLAESALPVYILHQGAIVIPGYFIIQLQAGIATKFTLLLLTSVVLTVGVYHFVVRPLPPLWFLFGMRPRRRPASFQAIASPVSSGLPDHSPLIETVDKRA